MFPLLSTELCKNIAQFELTKYYKLTKLRFYYCIQKLATACIMMKIEYTQDWY